MRRVCCSRRSPGARVQRRPGSICSVAATVATNSARGMLCLSFGARSRRPTNSASFSMSRGPISRRSGTPFLIQFQTLSPPRSSRSSTMTLTGRSAKRCARSSAATLRQYSSTRALVFVSAPDRHDDDVHRRQPRRQHEAVVVGVRHDQAADQARRDAPARGPGVLLLAVLIEELDVERLGEVLAEEVAGAGLQRLAVLHHRFDAEACRPRRGSSARRSSGP